MTENELYKRALKDWGKEPQMMQVIEEMSELTKEILKNINRKKDNIAELIEDWSKPTASNSSRLEYIKSSRLAKAESLS